MNELKKIILQLLHEIEKKDSNVTIAGGRGYSVGKAYPSKGVGVLRLLGKVDEIEEKEEEVEQKPVTISKAFKKRRKNDTRN
jgi:hypothetical protein